MLSDTWVRLLQGIVHETQDMQRAEQDQPDLLSSMIELQETR